MYKASSASFGALKCPKKVRQEQLIQRTVEYVKIRLDGEPSGHDWWHIYRVWTLAKKIGDLEEADLFIVELAALLHDIADWKLADGDEEAGPNIAREWLESLSVDESDIAHICKIIRKMSFKGAGVSQAKMETIEGMVVQDADRLDAVGAIGIARCFTYGGFKNNIMHDPACEPINYKTAKEYLEAKSTSINHFHEKLFLLKDKINTKVGLEIAEKRHDLMLDFLDSFLAEWDGKDLEV